MGETVCCVCHRAVGSEAKRLGDRAYCERHYGKVTQDRPSVWRAGLFHILGQGVFVLVVVALVTLFKPTLTGLPLLVAGLLLALIPAAIWLIFFYQQDRLEAEPKGYVFAVFVLGALLAQAIGIPLLEDIFEVRRWLPMTPWSNILGSILVIGFTQEFLKYAAVRYSIYPSVEFDERADGIVYGTAAGLGYATMLNAHYIIIRSGVNLEAGAIRVAVTALAQASFSGLMGYFLGRAKFENESMWLLPGGLALASLLNGLFTYLRGELTTTRLSLVGGGFNPWPGLVLATIVALATFGALFYLIRRANSLTLAGTNTNPAKEGSQNDNRTDNPTT